MLGKYIQMGVIIISLFMTAEASITSTQIKITPSSTANSQAGYAVSISGDTALVGAIGDDGSEGTAYIYTRSGTTWSKTATLKATDTDTGDNFGWSVALESDTAVIGAIGDEDKGDYTGSAYIFTSSGNNWTQAAKLTASDAAAYNQFGYAVSISGDTVLIGADYTDNTGAAYIFVKPSGGWSNMTETAKLTTDDNANDVGCSVSLYGDTALVGADDTDEYNGSAYIFEKPSGGWVNMTAQTAKLTASDSNKDDEFGYAVSLSDDMAFIGAVGDESDQGSVYIFNKPDDRWVDMTQTAKITASDGDTNDTFGSSLSVSGDTVVIGAKGDENTRGAAYVFTRSGSNWIEQNKLLAGDGSAADDFGISIALSSDTVLIGANGGDSYAGAAYFNRYACGFTANVIAGQWSMIGIPCDLGANNTVEDVFGDNFNTDDYYDTWILYKWNRDTDDYSYLDLSDTLNQNEGYWLKKTDSDAIWDASGTLTTNSETTDGCISGKTCISLPLTSAASASETKFNLVGHPQNITSRWGDIRFYVEDTGTAYTPNQAEDANIASATFWKYSGSSYDAYDDSTPGAEGSLNSHEGLWVKMLGSSYGHSVKIIIPYGE